MMEAEYSDDMIDVELKAMWPEYGLTFFPKGHLYACTDQSLNDAMEEALRPREALQRRATSLTNIPATASPNSRFRPTQSTLTSWPAILGPEAPPPKRRGRGGVRCDHTALRNGLLRLGER